MDFNFWGGCGKCPADKHCLECNANSCNNLAGYKLIHYCYERENGKQRYGRKECISTKNCHISVDYTKGSRFVLTLC